MLYTNSIKYFDYVNYAASASGSNPSLPFGSCSAAKVECKARPHSASTTSPLFHVGARRPNCCVVRHVIVWGEQLHFGPDGRNGRNIINHGMYDSGGSSFVLSVEHTRDQYNKEIQVYFTSRTLVFTTSLQFESTKSLYKFPLEASSLYLQWYSIGFNQL